MIRGGRGYRSGSGCDCGSEPPSIANAIMGIGDVESLPITARTRPGQPIGGPSGAFAPPITQREIARTIGSAGLSSGAQLPSVTQGPMQSQGGQILECCWDMDSVRPAQMLPLVFNPSLVLAVPPCVVLLPGSYARLVCTGCACVLEINLQFEVVPGMVAEFQSEWVEYSGGTIVNSGGIMVGGPTYGSTVPTLGPPADGARVARA